MFELQETVDVPDPPVIVPNVRMQDMLVELVVTTRATVPTNPSSGRTLIPEVPATPALTVKLV